MQINRIMDMVLKDPIAVKKPKMSQGRLREADAHVKIYHRFKQNPYKYMKNQMDSALRKLLYPNG